MDIDKPFTSYEEVEQHALKLRLQSETALLRFQNHWHAFADKDIRGPLLESAVSDAIHGMKPVQKAAELMTSGGIGSQLIMGMLTRKGGLMRRLLTTVAVTMLPNLLAKVPWMEVASKVGGALRTARAHEHNGHGVH